MVTPVLYADLTPAGRKAVREMYVKEQRGLCLFCEGHLSEQPPKEILDKRINTKLFPEGFFFHPIHLQHDHKTGLTEGAVHAYCNAVLWQYHGR